MSDTPPAASDKAGSLSPRNVDTIEYEVVHPDAIVALDGLERFKVWPWGSHTAWIIGLGPIVSNSQIRDWEKQGLIKRLTPGRTPFATEESPMVLKK